jgi:hypothetical protein
MLAVKTAYTAITIKTAYIVKAILLVKAVLTVKAMLATKAVLHLWNNKQIAHGRTHHLRST